MFDTIIRLDQAITIRLSILLPHDTIFDAFFSFFSLHGLTVIIWMILFFVFWQNERKDKTHHHFFLAFVTSFSITTFLVNILLKNIVQRTRPWIDRGLLETSCPSDFSFPSGHAAGAFAGAVIFSYFDKKRQWLYYGIATCISFSRIYLGCHYLLDVVFGALIGFFISKAIILYLSSRKIL